ncbi:hypothetical protein ACJX0J_019784, partial [Zea mays]
GIICETIENRQRDVHNRVVRTLRETDPNIFEVKYPPHTTATKKMLLGPIEKAI